MSAGVTCESDYHGTYLTQDGKSVCAPRSEINQCRVCWLPFAPFSRL